MQVSVTGQPAEFSRHWLLDMFCRVPPEPVRQDCAESEPHLLTEARGFPEGTRVMHWPVNSLTMRYVLPDTVLVLQEAAALSVQSPKRTPYEPVEFSTTRHWPLEAFLIR